MSIIENNVDRLLVYSEYSDCVNKSNELRKLADEAKSRGDILYETHKHEGESAYDLADTDWSLCDDLNAKADMYAIKINELLDVLKSHDFTWLNDFESCAMIGHVNKIKVKVTFLDKRQVIGHIYPWESDYCGPPFYLLVYQDDTAEFSRSTVDLDYGWEVYTVEKI